MPIGTQLDILTNKWSVVRDMQAYAHMMGHKYLGYGTHPDLTDTWWVYLEKGLKPSPL
jgi:TusA-related sulfurtransferase